MPLCQALFPPLISGQAAYHLTDLTRPEGHKTISRYGRPVSVSDPRPSNGHLIQPAGNRWPCPLSRRPGWPRSILTSFGLPGPERVAKNISSDLHCGSEMG